MKYFCSKCGKTTQYNFELPKFCSSCGQSFASKLAPTETKDKRDKFLNELKLKKNINSNIEDDILYNSEDIEEENYDVQNFKKIKPSFKVDIFKNKGESFGSLIENPSKPYQVIENLKIEPKTKEEVLADFKREAGTLRAE